MSRRRDVIALVEMGVDSDLSHPKDLHDPYKRTIGRAAVTNRGTLALASERMLSVAGGDSNAGGGFSPDRSRRSGYNVSHDNKDRAPVGPRGRPLAWLAKSPSRACGTGGPARRRELRERSSVQRCPVPRSV